MLYDEKGRDSVLGFCSSRKSNTSANLAYEDASQASQPYDVLTTLSYYISAECIKRKTRLPVRVMECV
jgi:hypothetical protein